MIRLLKIYKELMISMNNKNKSKSKNKLKKINKVYNQL